jgi:hypothetical protein
VTRQWIGGERSNRGWRREWRLLERPPHSSLVAKGGWRRNAMALIPQRSLGWRPDVCRSCRPVVGLRGHLLCRPSPPPPYRARRPNCCRYGSRGRPRAADDVALIKSGPDVELVLCEEVGHVDRVIAGADVIGIEDSASGAAQSVRRRPVDLHGAREHSLEEKRESIDRYDRCSRAVLSGRSDAATGNGGSLAPSWPRAATSRSTPAISRPLP